MSGEPVEVTRASAPCGALTRLLSELAFLPEETLAGEWDGGLRAGDRVAGRFELVREIGRGGFGVVFEAEDLDLRRKVAFKSVRAGGRPEVLEERLVREAEAAAQLSHPNIVTLFDAGRSDKGPYLVLELLRGRSLAARLAADGPLRPDEALRIASEVARGVAHAHAHGVIHRDLKPENVFLCDDGQVKVVDFGLALALGRRRAEGGTPVYMAPEQRRGEPEDERSDVYALGVMLHRMLSGELPADAPESSLAVVSPSPPPAAATPAPPAPPAPAASARPPAAPEPAARPLPGPSSLGLLVARMRAPDPSARPRDGAAVLAELAAVARDLATSPGPAAPARRRHSRTVIAATVLAAAALATGGTALWRLTHRGPTATAAAPPDARARAVAFSLTQRAQTAFTEAYDEPLARRLLHHALTFDPGSAQVRFQLVLLGETPEVLTDPEPPPWAEALPDREQRILEVQRARADGLRRARTAAELQAAQDADRRRFEALAAAYPDDRQIAYLAGEAASARGELWGAAEAYRAALVLDPGHLPALDRRFQAWTALGVWGRADDLVQVAQDAVRLRPTPASQVYVALAASLRGDADEARRQAARAQAGAATLSFHVSWRLASVLLDAGATTDAEAVLRPFTRPDADASTRRRAGWELGRALAARGRVAELRREAAALSEADEQRGLRDALEGAARAASGDDRGAAEAWLRAADAGARWPDAPHPALVARAGDLGQAERACRGTGGKDRLLCDAVLTWKRGDPAGAIQALQRLRAQYAEPLPDLLLGELHASQGEPVLAAAALHRFLDLHDGFALDRPRARLLLAEVLERQGYAPEAREELERLQAELSAADAGLPVAIAAAAAHERLAPRR